MSQMHDKLPPEPTHETLYEIKVTIRFDLSLDASLLAANEVEKLVKSYTHGQLIEDIQDGFEVWCASLENDDKDLDFALATENLRLNISVPPDKSHEQLAREKAERERRAARASMIKMLLAEHRASMAQPTPTKPTLRLLPGKVTRSRYTTPEERDEARKARYNATRDERNARRRAKRAQSKNDD